MRNYINGVLAIAGTLALTAVSAMPASAQAAGAAGGQAAGGAQKPAYTMPEYNAFTACQGEKDPNQQSKCLEDFVMRFPMSSLMPYVLQLEVTAYLNLKNYTAAVAAADKLIALDGVDPGVRAQVAIQRLQAYAAGYDPKSNDTAGLTKDRDLGLQVPKMLQQIPPRQGMTPEQMQAALKPAVDIVDNQVGWADLQLKDYGGAAAAYKDALANKSDDAAASYELGTALLAANPPQTMDGFWAIARAISLKVPSADKVQDYLRSRVLAYEQPGCDGSVDKQVTDMVQLAANSPERPTTFNIPSADDLGKIRSSSTILTIVGDLSGGGDKATTTWLAVCGSELSAVTGKIISATPGDGIVAFQVYTGATSDDMQSATTANMAVKVYTAAPATPPPAPAGGAAPQITPQPDVVRLMKDDPITFSGTITSYDPSPFLLHWDDVKVDPSVIPSDKAPAKGGKRPAAK